MNSGTLEGYAYKNKLILCAKQTLLVGFIILVYKGCVSVALFTKNRKYIPNFSLKIIVRQFLSPFHKDYLTTNCNLTTKTTLTIKNSSLGVLDTTLCDKVCQ